MFTFSLLGSFWFSNLSMYWSFLSKLKTHLLYPWLGGILHDSNSSPGTSPHLPPKPTPQ